MRRRRLVLAAWILAAVAIFFVAVFAIAHLAGVQRIAWNKVTASIEAATGYSITADRVSVRLLSGRFEAEVLQISVDDKQLAAVERVVATWTWRGLLGQPRRLESVVIVSPEITLENLPIEDDAEDEPLDAGELLGMAEVGSLEIWNGRLTGAAADVGWSISEVQLKAGLEDRRAFVELAAGGGALVRDGRTFELGALDASAEADPRGIRLDHLRLGGEVARIDVGQVGAPWTGATEMRVPLRAEAELGPLLDWWDPSLPSRIAMSGKIALDGVVGRDTAGAPFAELEHRGEPITVSGIAVDSLSLSYADAVARLSLGGAEWGKADVVVDGESAVAVNLLLEDALLQPLVALSPQPLPFDVPAGSRAAGTLRASLALPVQPETVTGSADLVLTWPAGRLAVSAEGGYDAVAVKDLSVRLPGGALEARGRIEPQGNLDMTLDLSVEDPARALASVAQVWPGAPEIVVGGGLLDMRAAVSGTVRQPFIDANLVWQTPMVADESFNRLDASATGGAVVEWDVVADLVEGTSVHASGRTAMTGYETSADWSVFSEDLEVLAARVPSGMAQSVCGRLAAAGHLTWTAGVWRVGGTARGIGLGTGHWMLDGFDLAFVAEPDRAEVTRFSATLAGARLTGWASVPLHDLDAEVAAHFDLVDLDPATLRPELPFEAAGAALGSIDVAGTIAEPNCELKLEFSARATNAPVQSAALRASLVDGLLRLVSANIESAAGPLAITAEVPLGDLPLPEWLWPQAPSGPIRAAVHAQRLRAAPLLRSLGLADLQDADIVCDLDAEVRWDLLDEEQRIVEMIIGGAEIRSDLERLQAEGPIRLVLRDGHVVLDPVLLTGEKSRLELVGSYDFASGELTTTVRAKIDPAIAQLLPLPLTIRGPVDLDAELGGPLSALRGTVRVNHRDGVMVMRDPAMEVRDLFLLIEIEDGVPNIADGSAGVNRGTALIGGSWDTEGGQGIVIALDDVAFLLPYGILSRWNGTLNIDPEIDRIARMHGDLELEGGLWDRSFDYTGVLLGTGDQGLAADDPLNDIVLDLEVRGRSGIAVNNNLGDFKVTWDLLHVGGTLATPLLEGEVKIAEGGQLTVAGTSIPVRRGVVEFTGQPGAEPRLEIVSASDVAVFEPGSGGQIDPTLIATKGLATGLGKALGLENETLRPAEIAIETGTDTASRFAVGQRLSRNLSLIVSTDLANAQDVETLLQLQNLPRLKGLALQAFQETATEEIGGAVIERLRWGGSAVDDAQPKIYRIRLEGEWPVSKRRLKKAAGIAKGKPYDRFLLFAAGIRMEQELAAHGYYDARVTAEAEGSAMLPTLVFSCEPGPLREVVFTGDEPPKETRRRVRTLYQAPPQEDSSLAAMRQVLTRHYAGEGYPDAAVSIARVDDRVTVEIDPGVRRILVGPQIEGVPPRSALWLQAALGSPAELAAALADPARAERIIRKALRDTGFREVEEIRLSTEAVDDEEEVVKIEIVPGRLDTIGDLELSGTDPLGLLETGDLGVRPGMTLDRHAVDRAVNILRREYQNAGYAEVQIATRLEEVVPFEWTVWFEMAPGPKVTVDAITIKGLAHLDEEVIRHGLSFAEGDLLRVSELDASATKIAGFAPVERVEVKPIPSAIGTSTVEIAVAEKPRWTVGVGALWRSERGLQALIDLRDDNLFNRGFSLNLRGSWEADERRALIVASLPPLPGGRLSTSLTADYYEGDSKVDPKVLNEETTGGSFELSYLISSASKVSAYTRLSDTFLFEKIPDDFFPFEQTLRAVTLGGQFTRDTFDDPFDPRSGSYFAADVEWSSSAFGSDLDAVRALLTGSVVLEPRSRWTWAHRLRLGIAEALKGTNLDPTQRYFAGGQASMRGFATNSVGPLDLSQDGGLVGAGGGALFILNEELRVPVWKGLRLAVFTDIGQVWEDWSSADSELSLGAGVGFRYSTPIGPLWADIAWPVVNKGISEGAKYYFGIGRTF